MVIIAHYIRWSIKPYVDGRHEHCLPQALTGKIRYLFGNTNLSSIVCSQKVQNLNKMKCKNRLTLCLNDAFSDYGSG